MNVGLCMYVHVGSCMYVGICCVYPCMYVHKCAYPQFLYREFN